MSDHTVVRISKRERETERQRERQRERVTKNFSKICKCVKVDFQ